MRLVTTVAAAVLSAVRSKVDAHLAYGFHGRDARATLTTVAVALQSVDSFD